MGEEVEEEVEEEDEELEVMYILLKQIHIIHFLLLHHSVTTSYLVICQHQPTLKYRW